MEVKPGTYQNARINDYGIRPDKNENPRVWVEFTITQGDESAQVRWSNDLDPTPKTANGKTFNSQAITMDTLKKMGFNGTVADVPGLYDGKESGLLNPLLDFTLVVEKSNDGKYINVKYINLPGEGPGKQFESKEAMKAAFAKLGVSTAAPSKNYLS